MRLLITGGCGFIGSNFIRYILNKYSDYNIVNLDKLTYCGNLDNLKDIQDNKRYKFIRGDICDKEIVDKLTKGTDVVVNFAAETHVDRSLIDSRNFIETNIFGTHIILEYARRNRVSKYIQISTDEVYGSIEEGSFKEDSSLNPSNPYSASKAGGDMLALSYWTTYKLPVIITRSSNNFGSYQYPEKVIPLFVTNALNDIHLPLYGDGRNVRDWLYVIDNCEAIDLVIHKGKEGEIYNVAGGYEIPNIELTRKILKIMEKSENLIQYVKDRLGHDRRYSIDCTKIKALGWNAKHNFDDALLNTINFYKNNRWWWEKLK